LFVFVYRRVLFHNAFIIALTALASMEKQQLATDCRLLSARRK
jgi:hypothetical protein